jgi:uncharacterized protein (DUF2236 family)
MPSVFPPDEEIPSLVPRPGSLTWKRAGDARLMAASGYALLLQTTHPTVGAGVAEHSLYSKDPWGRLLRTLDFTNLLVYGGPDAAAKTGRFVREMHKRIKGTKPDGERYSALEPEAYAWVHTTLAEAIVTASNQFAKPFSDAQAQQFWHEWRNLGRLLGIRDRDLPRTWDGMREHFDWMVEHRLESTPAAQDLLTVLQTPAGPPVKWLNDRAWRTARVPIVQAFTLGTVGLLPPVLRERLGLDWSRAKQLELSALGATTRAMTPVMPASLRNMGPAHLRWRREEIARTYLADGPHLASYAKAA